MKITVSPPDTLPVENVDLGSIVYLNPYGSAVWGSVAIENRPLVLVTKWVDKTELFHGVVLQQGNTKHFTRCVGHYSNEWLKTSWKLLPKGYKVTLEV